MVADARLGHRPVASHPRMHALGIGREQILVAALMAVALLAHAVNMFNVPGRGFTDDEGIYTAQAWAVLRQGTLSPYTYFYDHAPGGWIQLAGWMGLTGGPLTFGSAVHSGRLLMLLLHVGMVPLLYHLTRKLGGGAPAAALAALFFSLSPLSVFYGRLVLLDSIMLFWALLSLDLLLNGWGRLSRIVLSGVCFGVAMLSKESALVLLPALLYIAWRDRRGHQGRFAVGAWLVPMLLVASFYPLYALLKHELLPSGVELQGAGSGAGISFVFSGEEGAHVSLLEALRWQATRSGGGPFNLDNQFWRLVRTDWLTRDAFLLVGGAAAVALNLLRGIRDRRALAAGLLGALPLLYLARGGVVFGHYILLAVPFLALNLALLVAPLLARVQPRRAPLLAALAALALVGGYWQADTLRPLYRDRSGEANRDALAYIKTHVPAESRMIVLDDLWTDLREPGLGGPSFPHAHSHWKVAQDPAVRIGVFADDWRSVDYLVISPDLADAFAASENRVALEALGHATLVRRWSVDFRTVELWKVNEPGATEAALLAGGAAYLAARFERDGAYPDAEGVVTSESQAYAMLRAVWSGDRAAFDRSWAWTERHLINERGLLAWRWQGGAVTDDHAAADADTDAALALLLASRRWDDPGLEAAGRRLVRAIWRHEVVTVDGAPYLAAGDWADGPVVTLNPGYFSPYAYRIFAEADPGRDWRALITSGYDLLFRASAAPLGADRSAGLPPDWVGLDRRTGAVVPVRLGEAETTRYGYDAARTYWRVALDLRWSDDGRARAYLANAGFLRDEVRAKGTVSAQYAHNGDIVEATPSEVSTAGAIAALLTLDPDAAHGLFARELVGGVRRHASGVSWGNAESLYGQEWSWFTIALYADALPNLWHAP